MMTVKFISDRLVALLAILILWPLFFVIAILLACTQKGRVVFSQKRVGKGGELFVIYKFCTMTESSQGTHVTVSGDKRVTPLGGVLRKYKLDELPQLWNVLKGDMSFVGPRPDVPGYADMLQGEDRAILTMRPGITGPATLKYRNEEELLAHVADPVVYNDTVIFPDKVRLNLYYLRHYSLGMDLKIILATLLNRKLDYCGEII